MGVFHNPGGGISLQDDALYLEAGFARRQEFFQRACGLLVEIAVQFTKSRPTDIDGARPYCTGGITCSSVSLL